MYCNKLTHVRATLARVRRSDEWVMIAFVASMALADGAILFISGLLTGGVR